MLWQGDGMQGWAEDAPYNAIHVGASAAEIPEVAIQNSPSSGISQANQKDSQLPKAFQNLRVIAW